MEIVIRPYQPDDRKALVSLLVLNVPHYFAAEEVNDFESYLDTDAANYLVVESYGRIVGAGGYNLLDQGSEARISWDFFHPEVQGKGFGSQLLQYRLNSIKQSPGVNRIVVRTSQLAFRFYEKHGFELLEVIPDFWAKGYDLYHMKLTTNLTPQTS